MTLVVINTMTPFPLAASFVIAVMSTALGQNVVFRSGFEYPNGEVPPFEDDMSALNGALEQVGLWSGELPMGLGEGQPRSAFMRVVGEDQFFIIDRPEASMVLVATPSETVPIDGTRVSYQFSTKRVGGHAKNTHFVGLDAEGRESFHVVAGANSSMAGEMLRLGIEVNGGELVWDMDTADGEDNDGDFPFNNSTGNTNNVGTVVLDLRADGYVMTVSKGLDNFLYKTELLPYNDLEATGVATMEFRANGGGTGVSSGLWLDDVTISHSTGVSDPGVFVERTLGFGRIPQSDEVFERILAISNEGDSNILTISGVSTSGANPDNFAITDFPDSLAPGEVGELTVTFDRKGGVGEFSAMLVLATNDPDAQDQSAMIEVTATVPAGGDTDEDGLTDATEIELGTNPGLIDTDGDGLGDGQEVNELQTSPLEVDTDGDGFEDGEEVAFGSDPTDRDADLDMDGLTDEEEFANGANPGAADTDGDTLEDGEEVNGNPATDPALADTDGDSLTDNEEKARGTNPTESDSDGDSLDDGFELLLGSGPNDIDSPVEGGGTAVVFQSGFEYEAGLPRVGLDARNLNGAIDQLGSFSGEVPEADFTGGLLDGETISEFDIAGDTFILVDRPLAPHVLTAELVSPVPLAGATMSFEYATRRTGDHPKDVSFVGIDDTGAEVFEVVVSAKSDPPDGQRLGFRGPDVDGELVDPIFDFDVVSGADLSDDLPNVGANPGLNGVAAVKVFLLAEGYVIDFRKPGRGYRTSVLPYRNAASTLTSVEIRVNGGGTGVSSGFFLDDFVVGSAGKPSDPNIIASPRVNLGLLAVTPAQSVSVRVLNTGASQSLNLSNVSVSGQDESHFTVTSFPQSILPGEEGFIDLLFDAELRSGPFEATLAVASDDPDVPTTQIELTAVGVDLAGPVAHFSLDEPLDATTLAGISKNTLSASVEVAEGAVSLGVEGLVSGSAAAISGNGSIRIADESVTELDALSVALWVNVDAVGAAAQTLFAKGDPPSPNIALITLGGDLAWFVAGDAAIRSETGTALIAGQTHHVAAVYSNERAAIYVDGLAVVEVSEPEQVNLDVTNAWFFGGFGSLPFSGRLDDIQLYDRGLVTDEVVMLRDMPGLPLSSGAPVVEAPRERFAQVQVSRSGSGNLFVRWLAAQDVGYLVEFSNDLKNWETIEDTRFSVQVNDAVLEDANAARTQVASGYYRVVIVP